MRLFSDSIGRKMVMAITGLLMVLFVIGHLLGNLTIFAGANGINAYAHKLHALGPVVWGTRLVMGTAVVLHVMLSIRITMENRAAKPIGYQVSRSLRATFAGKTMIWTGLALACFVLYHLAQFTFHVTPNVVMGVDSSARFDVYTMVVKGLGNAVNGGLYLVAMVALFLHLSHGIQSVFQTLGLSNVKLLPQYESVGKVLSAVFLVGFGAIPAVILVGILK